MKDMDSDGPGLIELDGVEKVFDVRRRAGLLRREKRQVRAVDGITLRVARGEMVGYIGPNGAGKSTTIKMLTGILTPSAGKLRVAGIDPSRERTKLARRIGVVFGQRTTLWWDLPLIDSYRLVHRMYRIPDRRYRENLERCVELLELGELLEVPVRQLSLGQRMRGDIAAALLHDPEVLYLDEPTIGLDVISKARVREFLRNLNAERRTTVVLTTHDLTDIEQLCERVMVIDHGRIDVRRGARRAARGGRERADPGRRPRTGAAAGRAAGGAGGEGGGAAAVAGLPGGAIGGAAGGEDRGGVSADGSVGAGAGHRVRHREDALQEEGPGARGANGAVTSDSPLTSLSV